MPSNKSNEDEAAMDDVREIQNIKAEQFKAYDAINALNPLTGHAGKSPVPRMSGAPLTGPAQKVQDLMSNPAVQGYANAAELIRLHPARTTLLYAEIGWILFIFVFRAWRFAQAKNWAHRLWTRAWTLVLYVVGAGGVLPWMILGDPYAAILKRFLEGTKNWF